ncbi:MAG TPA: hypothetical protein VFR89_04160, partial [candidate division Zixibacteria bacterium]|nr:hypothetical protein [candidate division Zixibacteria bacterium]
MKKLLFFSFFLPAALFAQDTLTLNSPLSVVTDYAYFREGDSIRLEIYYALSSTELTLTPTDSTTGGPGKNLAYVLAYLDLFTPEGRPLDSLSKTTAFRVARADTTNELSEIFDFWVRPGNFLARLSVWDMKSGRAGQDTLDLVVPDLTRPGLTLSSLQLARLIADKKR